MWKDEIFYQTSWDYENDSGYMYGHPALETAICKGYKGQQIDGWTYQPGNFIDISYDLQPIRKLTNRRRSISPLRLLVTLTVNQIVQHSFFRDTTYMIHGADTCHLIVSL